MDNWRKFGNPDGKQPMEVSIALPTFLLEKEHHNTILIIYLIAMVVIIPCKTERISAHNQRARTDWGTDFKQF